MYLRLASGKEFREAGMREDQRRGADALFAETIRYAPNNALRMFCSLANFYMHDEL